VVKQLAGRTPGGLGITTILACTFFAAISGSGPGTVAAVGTLLIPTMIKNGYSRSYAAAAASSGGTIGIMIPPSNPLIIYAVVCNISILSMFTAGFVPGFTVAFAMTITAYLIARRHGFSGDMDAPPFHLGIFARSCLRYSPSLLTPFIVLGSIYGGFATPVEASVVAILWAVLVGCVINRALRPIHFYKSLLAGATVCGSVLIIIAAATLFGRLLTIKQAPQLLVQLILTITRDPMIVLLMILGMLILIGMFMETLATIIILMPILMPVLQEFGINPIHFGILLVVTDEMSLLTPPIGVNIFVSSAIAKVTVEKVYVAVLPYLVALLACLIFFTFMPDYVLWLPKLLDMNIGW
jgi:C4-dicarboxylate transporter DctM subunit